MTADDLTAAVETRPEIVTFVRLGSRAPGRATSTDSFLARPVDVPSGTVSRVVAAALLGALVLVVAVGSASADKGLTIPRYSQFPATTIPVARGTPVQCRTEADSFSRNAKAFLRPYPSDTDIYRVLARVQFTAFMAHRCEIAVLRKALSRRLTVKQLREVLAFFGFMGEVGRALARSPGY